MELVLTVVGLLAAIYAIIPRYRQLDLSLKLGWFSWLTIGICLLYIVCLDFYDYIASHVGQIIPWSWPNGITPEKAIHIAIVVLIVYLVLRWHFANLTKQNIFKFQKLTEELIWESQYSELISLLERHLIQLFKIARADFVLNRIRSKLAPPLWHELNKLRAQRYVASARHSLYDKVRSKLKGVLRKVSVILPRYEKEQNAAQECIRLALLSRPCVEAISRIRPYLGIRILREFSDKFERFDFLNLYLKELLGNQGSILYSELANNQNLSGNNRYQIPETNRLLYYLFIDAKVAQELDAYKPVGEFALQELDRQALDPIADPYNKKMDDFESEASRSPLVATIHFFSIMVTEALFQGIEWHMWLYYFPHIVKKIVHNYAPSDPQTDFSAEWPIRYNFLIYRIVETLRDWIEALEEIPSNQANVVLKSATATHENENIPKSSILALGDCLWLILDSDALGDHFQFYVLDIVFRIYFHLLSLHLDDYAVVLLASIRAGGSYSRDDDEKYKSRLLAGFNSLEKEYVIKYDPVQIEDLKRGLG